MFEPGDIWACFSRGWPARAISYGTFRPWAPKRLKLGPSHVALCCESPRHGPLWVESTTLCERPCLFRGEAVAGCQAHRPEERIEDYCAEGGRVDLYRLSPIATLNSEKSELLSRILLKYFVGRSVPYDLVGALVSGTVLAKRLPFLLGGLERGFCSELGAAVLMELGLLNRANPTRFSPASLMRRLVWNGTYRYARSFDAHSRPLKLFPRLAA